MDKKFYKKIKIYKIPFINLLLKIMFLWNIKVNLLPRINKKKVFKI